MAQVKQVKSKEQVPPDAVAAHDHSFTSESLMAASIAYLRARLLHRLLSHLNKIAEPFIYTPPKPLDDDESPLAAFLKTCPLTDDEFTVLMLSLAPHIIPGFMDTLVEEVVPSGGNIPELGGVRGQSHRGMLPTGETVLFVLAGTDVYHRMQALRIFDRESLLLHHRIISLDEPPSGEPVWSGRLLLDQEYDEVFTTGRVELPKLSMRFPAEHINTEMEWSDLVLGEQVWQSIREIEHWVRHHHTLMDTWGMKKRLKPGYRALFYGPSGTGKTLTATLLGKYTGRDVFRIDLSRVVSKYIGETEKSLASLFDRAEHKDWILFFDEADAIFSKRTGVRDAHDKYANQEVSYLLQRIESFAGLVILASNFRNNIDYAFIRRFNTLVYFPSPDYPEKLRLWTKAFPADARLSADVSFNTIAAEYDLTGAQIMNIVQHTCLQSLASDTSPIGMEEIAMGIRRELSKEGK
jgi:AAA+ superfamily predicted ATPase